MDLSIIIVSYNTKDLLKKCLDSIYQNKADLDLEIFVVDNNSADKTNQLVAENFQTVKLISNDKNFGFAYANNQALKIATGKYILLLNPDTEILPNSLKKSIEYLNSNPNCGGLGVKLLNSDKSIQPSVRHFPSVWPIFLMLIKAPKIIKNIKAINHYLNTDFNYDKLQVVDQVMGAFILIPKKVLARIGSLDERFFIWFEEVDLCLRIKKSGFDIIYNPNMSIVHHGGKSFAPEKIIKKQWLFFQSALKYFLKHGFFKQK